MMFLFNPECISGTNKQPMCHEYDFRREATRRDHAVAIRISSEVKPALSGTEPRRRYFYGWGVAWREVG